MSYSLTFHKGGHHAFTKTETGSSKSGGIRSKITSFSSSSRLRAIKRINSVDTQSISARPVFLTLTYPANFPRSHVTIKRHLDLFIKKLLRIHPDVCAFWRLEYQPGRLAPHFHMILIFPKNTRPIKNIKWFRRWLARAWYMSNKCDDIKNLRAGTQADFIRSWKGVLYYTSKYIAKACTENASDVMDDTPGRFWGIVNRFQWPIYPEEISINRRVFIKMNRVFRKYVKAHSRYKRTFRNNGTGTFCFISDKTAVSLLHYCSAGGISKFYIPHSISDLKLLYANTSKSYLFKNF